MKKTLKADFKDPWVRDKIQFYFIPSLNYITRFFLAFVLIITGVGFHVFSRSLFLGILCITFGNVLLIARGYSSKIKSIGFWEKDIKEEDWQTTTFEKLKESIKLTKKVKDWDEVFVDITCFKGIMSLIVIGVMLFVLTLHFFPENEANLIIFDAGLILLPHWIFGTLHGWSSETLEIHIKNLMIIEKIAKTFEGKTKYLIQPFLGVIKEDDKSIPVSARLMFKFPELSETFLGVQFQVSLNDVSGTKFPYVYAVMIARHEFNLFDKIEHLGIKKNLMQRKKQGFFSSSDIYVVETKHQKDVDVVVIRMKTSKNEFVTKQDFIEDLVFDIFSSIETLKKSL